MRLTLSLMTLPGTWWSRLQQADTRRVPRQHLQPPHLLCLACAARTLVTHVSLAQARPGSVCAGPHPCVAPCPYAPNSALLSHNRHVTADAAQVHAYLAAPGGRTAYLSELKSGSEVLVVDPHGRQRAAVVGRIKVEQRPLVSQPWHPVLCEATAKRWPVHIYYLHRFCRT